MLDTQSFAVEKHGSPRSFAFTFAFIFLVIAAWPLLNSGTVRLWALAVAAVLFVAGAIKPTIFSGPNKVWLKFGALLALVVSPIVMVIVYSVVVLPTGLCLKLLRKDLVGMRPDPKVDSYWIKREEQPGPMENQY